MLANIIVISLILLVVAYFWKKGKRDKQLKYIENYRFSPAILKRVKEKHDYLKEDDMIKVVRATRDYFYICNQANGKMVAMPSEIVDVLWHEFILFTREYQEFCKKGLGRFLHHTPTEAMKSKTLASEGIKRAWRLACAKANINPKYPEKLPLLFVIDTSLNIEGGFKYELNCKMMSDNSFRNSGAGNGCGGYCATDIGCASGCAGESGGLHESSSFFGDSDASSSCGSGCGGD